jgi:hypothetical protein
MPGGNMKTKRIVPNAARDAAAKGLEVSLEDMGYGVILGKANGYNIVYNSRLGTISCDCLDQEHRELGCKHIRAVLKRARAQQVL